MQKTPNAVVLKLEGSVRGPWVDELQKAWKMSAEIAAGEPVSIDLAAVSFVDETGRSLLQQMKRDGVVLNGASSFLRNILDDGNASFEQSRKD